MDFNSWNIVWSLCFGLLATLIVVGNVLTILIFVKRRLRKRTHFLLISLAVADLLVGFPIGPLFIAIKTTFGSAWHWTRLVFKYGDIFVGLASINTLAVISLERMYAVGWPIRHRTFVFSTCLQFSHHIAAIYSFNIITRDSFIYPLILFQSTPLSVMCTAYCVIWKKQKSPIGNRVAREARLAKTLGMITGASLLTWLPFQITNVLVNFNVIVYFRYLHATIYIVKILQFSNSLVNVIIYPFRISEFKNALLQMIDCCVIPCERGNEVAPIHQARLGQLHSCQELQVHNY